MVSKKQDTTVEEKKEPSETKEVLKQMDESLKDIPKTSSKVEIEGSYTKTNMTMEQIKAELARRKAAMLQQSPALQESLKKSVPKFYSGRITPADDVIFVFGSNPEGRHGAGAAKTAKDKFGAIYGQGEGLQGQSYALPTKRIEKSLPTSRHAKVKLDVLLAEKLLNGQEIQEIVVAPYHTKDKQEAFKDLKNGEILNVEETNGYSNNRTKRNLQVRVKEVSNDNGIVKATFELASANGERTIPESQIIGSIKKLYEVARQNPNKQFKIGYTNELHEYTLNGYQGSEMIRMFKKAGEIPENVEFSENWKFAWNDDIFNTKC